MEEEVDDSLFGLELFEARLWVLVELVSQFDQFLEIVCLHATNKSKDSDITAGIIAYGVVYLFMLVRCLRSRHLLASARFSTTPPQPPTIPNTPLWSDLQKCFYIIRPESRRFIANCVLTLVSSGIFMYLPNVFTDIQALLALNINTLPASEIWQQYLITTSKWMGIFGVSMLITYKRRFYFMDISNRIASRLRYVFYKKLLESDLYRTK